MATHRQRVAVVYDEVRRLSVLRDGVPFSRELTNAAWVVGGSAVKVDDQSFSLVASAGSSLLSPLVTEDHAIASGQGVFIAELRLASIDTGALPFPVLLEYLSNSIVQATTTLTFSQVGQTFSFLRSSVIGSNVATIFPQLRMTTGDAAKAATLELARLEYRQLTS